MIRPSLARFEEFQHIIRAGDYSGRGWGGSGIGNFWGGQTIQGIIPYFYHSLHPGDAMEMNRWRERRHTHTEREREPFVVIHC